MALINGGVPAWMLAKIRNQAEAFMTQRCTIKQQVTTQGDMFNQKTTTQTVAANVPCRLFFAGEQSRGTTEAIGGQESLVERYTLSVPYETTLGVDMTVEVEGINKVFHVTNILHAHTDAVDRQAVIEVRNG